MKTEDWAPAAELPEEEIEKWLEEKSARFWSRVSANYGAAPMECVAMCNALRSIASERAARVKAKRDARESHQIIDRIWAMLGNPSFEELNGRSIYDLIGELLDADCTAMKRALGETT